jgi:hypothetical protein
VCTTTSPSSTPWSLCAGPTKFPKWAPARSKARSASAIPAPLGLACAWASPSAATPPTRPSTLSPLLGALGARGSRAAQLEAGIVAGPLALNAFALGGGATGLTFYDGLVSRYFHSEASPLLATAIGVPDTHPQRYPRATSPAGRLRQGHEQAGLEAPQVSADLAVRRPDSRLVADQTPTRTRYRPSALETAVQNGYPR